MKAVKTRSFLINIFLIIQVFLLLLTFFNFNLLVSNLFIKTFHDGSENILFRNYNNEDYFPVRRKRLNLPAALNIYLKFYFKSFCFKVLSGIQITSYKLDFLDGIFALFSRPPPHI